MISLLSTVERRRSRKIFARASKSSVSFPKRLAEDLAMLGLRRSAMRRRLLPQGPDDLGAYVSDGQSAHVRQQIIAFIACNMRADERIGNGAVLMRRMRIVLQPFVR